MGEDGRGLRGRLARSVAVEELTEVVVVVSNSGGGGGGGMTVACGRGGCRRMKRSMRRLGRAASECRTDESMGDARKFCAMMTAVVSLLHPSR